MFFTSGLMYLAISAQSIPADMSAPDSSIKCGLIWARTSFDITSSSNV